MLDTRMPPVNAILLQFTWHMILFLDTNALREWFIGHVWQKHDDFDYYLRWWFDGLIGGVETKKIVFWKSLTISLSELFSAIKKRTCLGGTLIECVVQLKIESVGFAHLSFIT